MAMNRSEQEYEFEPIVDEEVERENELAARHPTPEQFFLREASKTLTAAQKQVWELFNYDKLTQSELATQLNISQQAVSKALQAIEDKIKKYVKNNRATYKLIKRETLNNGGF